MDLSCAEELSDAVVRAAARLRQMPEDSARVRPAPGKWSPIEIIGHLIDSASVNHERFVRARERDDLEFEGYEQVEWVKAQNYQEAHWPAIIDLWEALNLHVARVIAHTPDSVLTMPRARHNLDRIAWEVVPRSEPASLGYFMRDYLGHLKHHLRQIDTDLAARPDRQREIDTARPGEPGISRRMS